MLESAFGNKLVKALESAGAKTLKVHGSLWQESGWPDLQVYHKIWTGHLELKCGQRVLQLNQRICMRELQERGSFAWCLRLIDDDLIDVSQHDGKVLGRLQLKMTGKELLLTMKTLGDSSCVRGKLQ